MRRYWPFFIISIFIALTACASSSRLADVPTAIAPKIILDTDLGNDADDLGAIAMLHNYADQGRIDLLSIISWSNEEYAIPALAGVNRYYGRPALPIGVRDVPTWRTEWGHTKILADNFAHDLDLDQHVKTAVSLYRKQLAAAEDGSITIVTIGPLANIQNLLQSSPDNISPLSGNDLFHRKVKDMIIMGGKLPTSDRADPLEWNFNGNMKGVTQYVLNTVKRPIIFSGYEVGEAIKVGTELNDHPKDTPLYVGYKHFSENAFWIKDNYQGAILDNSTFDQTAVMVAAGVGENEFWIFSKPGRLSADAEGYNEWTADPTGNHRYMILNDNKDAAADYIAQAMMHIP